MAEASKFAYNNPFKAEAFRNTINNESRSAADQLNFITITIIFGPHMTKSIVPPLRVVFAGTPEFAAKSLSVLIDQQETLNIEIVAVYTQPDRKAGRGQKLAISAVKEVALANNLVVQQPSTFKKSVTEGINARETLRSYHPDVMIVAAYGLILPVGVLTIPKFGCLNIHASLLPRYRGAAPIHRALLAGDNETGITIMQMDQGLDTGDMLYKVSCPIAKDTTAASLHDSLADLGAGAIVKVLSDLPTYQANAKAQDDALANYAQKLTKDEGLIDWNISAYLIDRQIRGLNPWPGTFSFVNGKRVKILAAYPLMLNSSAQAPFGRVISVGKKAVLVACGTDTSEDSDDIQQTALAITELQFAGSKPMSAEQICHGNQINDGDIFAADTH